MSQKTYISKQCCDCADPPDAFNYKPLNGAATPKSIANEQCTERDMYNC